MDRLPTASALSRGQGCCASPLSTLLILPGVVPLSLAPPPHSPQSTASLASSASTEVSVPRKHRRLRHSLHPYDHAAAR